MSISTTKKEDWWFASKGYISAIQELPNYQHLTGFVYRITNLQTGAIYIGKKSLYTTRKKKISLKEKKATGTRKTFEYIKKESDWMKYYGSSKELQGDVKKQGAHQFHREILELCCSKKYLSYAELAWQVKLDVLKMPGCYNGNILGRFYSRDMENCK